MPSGKTALMFQESALFPWLTAGKNIELALRLGGVPRSEWQAEIARLLDLVHLNGQADKRVHELSGGMRQRWHLPAHLRSELACCSWTNRLRRSTRSRATCSMGNSIASGGADLTVIFVTHNVREAVRLGQRVQLMSSRPGMFVRQWHVDIDGPRRIESPGVSALSAEITEDLRREIRRHGR